jgi:hypothetical protein
MAKGYVLEFRHALLAVASLLTLAAASRAQDGLPTDPIDAPKPADVAAEPLSVNANDVCSHWMEVWGLVGFRGVAVGSRVAPNGQSYDPLGSLDLDLNVDLLPDEKLYLFGDSHFWLQEATPGVTNTKQGAFDFSKREYDMTVGAAWNYTGPFELRVFGYSYNNLNRGWSPTQPSGYLDGVGVENRYYFVTEDKYDVAKLDFLSVGYLPSKDLIGADGVVFKPGLFARAYLTYDLNILHSYLYADNQIFAESGFKPRLFDVDAGLAARPFERLRRLEFQLGAENTVDLGAWSGDHAPTRTRTLVYGGMRLMF